MPEAVRVGDTTAHGTPVQGQGSPDVFIGNMKAWRAIPADVGGGLEDASKQVKAIMDKFPSLPSPSDPAQVATKDLSEIFTKMLETATKAEAAAGMCGALAGVQSAFMSFQPTALSLLATYTSAAAAPAPGAEVAARLAFTTAFQAGLGAAMSAAVTAIAGAWDMNTCPAAIPGPPPHGPGLVTVGCKTIFINNMPAVYKGHQIIEAAGGPNAIQIGCGTVIFGDKAPSSGSGSGSGGGGGKGSSSSGTGASSGGAGAQNSSSSTQEEAAKDKKRDKTIWVRLDINPADARAARDKFVLVGSGGYQRTKTVKDDMVPGDAYVDLMFTEIDPDQTYTLRVFSDGGAPSVLLEDVGFDAFGGAGPASKDPEAQVEGPSAEEVSSEE